MSLSTDFLDIIREVGSPQTISAGTQLFRQDDPIQDIYLLEEGLVKLTRLEANGHESIGELRFSNALLGAASALAKVPVPLSAFTIIECKVARISVRDFLQLVESDTAFSRELLISISTQKGEQAIRLTRHSAFSTRAQLAQLLLLLIREFGVERKGKLQLGVPLAKQDMASLVGITPQHLSALLREMKDEGLIAEENGWVIFLALDRLTHEAETGEKSSFSSAS